MSEQVREATNPNGFTIKFLQKEASMDFEIFPVIATCGGALQYQKRGEMCSPVFTGDIESAEIFMKGFIKWDGCINFEFPEGKGQLMFHCCNRENTKIFDRAFEAVYSLAREIGVLTYE